MYCGQCNAGPFVDKDEWISHVLTCVTPDETVGDSKMYAYLLKEIVTDPVNGSPYTFPAGIPVNVIASDNEHIRIHITENGMTYVMSVPTTTVVVFDAPLDMAGI